jgi:hypothetical protein
MEQAIRDAGSNIPYVAHRRNNQPWLITLRVDDLIRFTRIVMEVHARISLGLTPTFIPKGEPTLENLK